MKSHDQKNLKLPLNIGFHGLYDIKKQVGISSVQLFICGNQTIAIIEKL